MIFNRVLRNKIRARPFSIKSSFMNNDEMLTELGEGQVEVAKEDISNAPKELVTDRIVRIYKESKSATQSGSANTKFWTIDWDLQGKGFRWEDDLIGYQASSDYMQGSNMKFDTREGAIRFAQGQGWNYYVKEPEILKFNKKEYSSNFYHSKGPLKHIMTK